MKQRDALQHALGCHKYLQFRPQLRHRPLQLLDAAARVRRLLGRSVGGRLQLGLQPDNLR